MKTIDKVHEVTTLQYDKSPEHCGTTYYQLISSHLMVPMLHWLDLKIGDQDSSPINVNKITRPIPQAEKAVITTMDVFTDYRSAGKILKQFHGIPIILRA